MRSFLVFGLFILLGLFTAWSEVHTVRLGYRLDAEQKCRKALEKSEQVLLAAIAHLGSSAVLAQRAAEFRLPLSPVSPDRLLAEGTPIGLPARAPDRTQSGSAEAGLAAKGQLERQAGRDLLKRSITGNPAHFARNGPHHLQRRVWGGPGRSR